MQDRELFFDTGEKGPLEAEKFLRHGIPVDPGFAAELLERVFVLVAAKDEITMRLAQFAEAGEHRRVAFFLEIIAPVTLLRDFGDLLEEVIAGQLPVPLPRHFAPEVLRLKKSDPERPGPEVAGGIKVVPLFPENETHFLSEVFGGGITAGQGKEKGTKTRPDVFHQNFELRRGVAGIFQGIHKIAGTNPRAGSTASGLTPGVHGLLYARKNRLRTDLWKNRKNLAGETARSRHPRWRSRSTIMRVESMTRSWSPSSMFPVCSMVNFPSQKAGCFLTRAMISSDPIVLMR